MLVEIATGQRFEMEGHPAQWDPKTANQQLLSLQKYVNSGEFHEDCRFPRYKAAVNKCLDPMLFRNAPFNSKKPTENLEQRRSILYKEIVDPLRQLIEGTGWIAELDDFERTALVPKPRTKPAPNPPTQVVISEMKAPAAPKGDPWLEEVAVLNQMLKRERRKATAKNTPFRIAILDTGYDESTPAFDIPGRSKKIKKWKDFVSGSASPVDTDGHGTHLLTLMLQLECPANIYVARITESSNTLHSADQNIAEGPRQSESLLQNGTHIQEIKAAIAEAVYIKRGAITFFAAANNDGFNSREMFPANLGESVISVRGTNRAGGFEHKYNPPTSSDEPVFGTLGVDVVSDWPGLEVGKAMSGCSVATPIAVVIAVMLLEYAAARPREFEPEDLKLMRTRRGVFEIFKEIGIHAGDRRYYVAPFSLFKLSEDVRVAKMKAALGRHPEKW
ncbi:peptidase S8/S53 domain-containing protein [Cercophora samala]|uniref:Peptidase S8/S53 domain-containing protein n=1 Tax=Cercophora samala TaxID=330535 RepID=A0AA40DDB6_9PEZI|nr:peptidase S8/S53 domain-containing protein [Cercophora samala]